MNSRKELITFESFPHLGIKIFANFDFKQLIVCRKVCRFWNKLINKNKLWCQTIISKGKMKLRNCLEFNKFIEWETIIRIVHVDNSPQELYILSEIIQAFFTMKSRNRRTSVYTAPVLTNNISHLDFIWQYLDSKCDLYYEMSVQNKPWTQNFMQDKIVHDGQALHLDDMFHIAAQFGHSIVLETLIQASPTDKNPPDIKGVTPLHVATKHGHLDCVHLLLEDIDDANPKDPYGTTPLHIAVEKGYSELIQLFLSVSIDKNPSDANGLTPLHIAAKVGDIDSIKLILDQELINRNPEDHRGDSPLHFAVENGHLSCVLYLMEQLENKNPGNYSEETCLHLAAKHGHLDIFQAIMNQSDDANPTNSLDLTPLDVAKDHDHQDIIDYILNFSRKKRKM